MLFKKIVRAQGQFAKVGEHIKDGDLITILDEGKVITGEYGDQTVFKIKTAKGEEMNKSFNQSSINNLIDAFGPDAANWVNKQVKVFAVKVMVTGKMRNVAYFAPEGWTMNDDGSFSSNGNVAPSEPDEISVDDF